MKRILLPFCFIALVATALSGCAPSASTVSLPTALPAGVSTGQPFELTSTAFQPNALIPDRYGCHGANLSPALAWTTPPAGTQSLALIMDDPDAVKVVGHVFDHWLLFNIPVGTGSLPEGQPASAGLPDGSLQGRNSFSRLGYGGPCPPAGQTHVYRFVLYALDTVLELKSGATRAELLKAIDGHILAQAELDGRYSSP